MILDKVQNDYFEWLYNIACKDRYAKTISYRKLLMLLHSTEFRYSIAFDSNREEDGVALRFRFSLEYDIPDVDNYLDSPCSVLEMLIALSLRCEENIMDDPAIGNRTQQWFWKMIANLGLGGMTDSQFDRRVVEDILDRFMDRAYEPDGEGSLFKIRHCDDDLRDVDIWTQLCWYINSIT